jgi:uncharacterized protein involved in copper resistance
MLITNHTLKLKNQSMKSIISGALAAGLVAVCLTVSVQAKTVSPVRASTFAISDTGKMGKMDKMAKGKKMDKMSNDKMGKDKMSKGKMSKDKMSNDKMGKKKMSKDTASKM